MAATKYTIFQLLDVDGAGDVWKPLGVGMGSSPSGAARDYFAQTDVPQPKGGEHYIAVPSGNIHPLPAKVETQTRLTFG